MHIAQRVAKMPNLVEISQDYQRADKSHVLPRREYVEVVAGHLKTKNALPENKLCKHLVPAIHTDGIDKGCLVKVCTDPECTVHFGNRQREEEQRLAWKEQRADEKRNAKQTASFQHLLLSETLKRVKPQLGSDQLRLLARFILATLPHEQVARFAKRHGLEPAEGQHDWHILEKARSLYKATSDAELTRLIFEAVLVGSAANIHAEKSDDLLEDAAGLYGVDARAIRSAVEKAEKRKEEKKTAAHTRKTASKQKRNVKN